jgi:raffinose/stachyose/melibiose transport system permease protein
VSTTLTRQAARHRQPPAPPRRRVRRTPASRATSLLGAVFMSLVAVLMLVPLYLVLVNSFKSQQEIQQAPFAATGLTPDYLVAALDNPDFRIHRAYGVTILLAVLVNLLSLAVSAPVSYVIARGMKRRHQLLLMFFLAGTFVPGQVLVIPMIYVLKTLGLMGTIQGFVLFETTLTLPVSVFLYVGFIRAIPPELDQAAMIDGAGPARVLWSVILPLMRPAVATCVVLHTLGVWKDFVNPQIILGPESGLYTVTTGIFTAIGPHNTDFTRLYPNVLLGIAPVLVFFVFMQRFIVSGLTAGATKG